MTPIATATKTALNANTILRDATFVLQMTRRVKAEIVAERSESTKPEARTVAELTASLVV